MKKVLILCTGNSCRSIIAEAIINKKLYPLIKAYSAGVKATKKINPNAKKVLQQNSCWDDRYYSKTIDDIIDIDFDLIITVCDNAKQTCPIFPKDTKVVHIGFEDPDKKEFEQFIKTYNLIEENLLPQIKKHFDGATSGI